VISKLNPIHESSKGVPDGLNLEGCRGPDTHILTKKSMFPVKAGGKGRAQYKVGKRGVIRRDIYTKKYKTEEKDQEANE